MCGKILTREERKIREILRKSKKQENFGVYFLYDEKERVIYIGKSESNMILRSKQSASKYKAVKVQYFHPRTKADTRIYEIYYINKFKPQYNRDAKTRDKLTIKLQDLQGSGIIDLSLSAIPYIR
jgi:excinuclease UvrABC nuclease subunit